LNEKLNLEKQRIELDREKIKIEQENFKQQQRLEKRKIYITAISIIIPVVAAFLIIYGNLQLQNQNAENEHRLAEEVAKTDFKFKAAEIVMNSRSVNETKNRAEVLKALFPEYLDTDFSASLDRFRLGNNTYGGGLLVYDPEVGEYQYYRLDAIQRQEIKANMDAKQEQDAELAPGARRDVANIWNEL